MRAGIYQGIGKVTVEDLPVPEPGPKDVLVRNVRAGICGTDLGAFTRGGDDVGIFPGNEFGHEFTSRVVEVGAEVEGITEGMRVWVNPCTSKRLGQGRSAVEVADSAGGLSEYIVVEEAAIGYNIHPLPDVVTFDEAVLVEPFSVAMHGLNAVDLTKVRRAIVFGAGAIGLGAVANLKAVGVEQVIVVDVVPHRLEVAHKLGGIPFDGGSGDAMAFARETLGTVRNMNDVELPDAQIWVDAAGAASVTEQYAAHGAPGSTLISLALSANQVTIPQAAFVLNVLSIVGRAGYEAKDVDQVIGFMAAKAYDATPVVTHHMPLEDLPEAFRIALEDPTAIKVVVDVE